MGYDCFRLIPIGNELHVQSLVGNLVHMLEEHGHIPNGARTYYINRRSAVLPLQPLLVSILPTCLLCLVCYIMG